MNTPKGFFRGQPVVSARLFYPNDAVFDSAVIFFARAQGNLPLLCAERRSLSVVIGRTGAVLGLGHCAALLEDADCREIMRVLGCGDALLLRRRWLAEWGWRGCKTVGTVFCYYLAFIIAVVFYWILFGDVFL